MYLKCQYKLNHGNQVDISIQMGPKGGGASTWFDGKSVFVCTNQLYIPQCNRAPLAAVLYLEPSLDHEEGSILASNRGPGTPITIGGRY